MYHWHDFENKRRGTPQFPLEFHHVEESHPRYVMPYHWHREIELIRVVEGSLAASAGGKSYSLNTGDILYVKQNAVHGAEPGAGCVYQCIVCDIDQLLENNASFAQYAKVFGGAGHTIRASFGKDAPEARAALTRLFNAMYARADGWQLAAAGSLFQFLGEVLDKKLFEEDDGESQAMQNTQSIARFSNVFGLIRSKCAEPITLEDMAAAANMSPNYFCQAFKEVTHYTPIEYLTHYRIEYAKYLLCAKDCTVQEAAYQSGFGSAAYFIKVFKNATGLTPYRYKKAHLSSI